MDVAKYPRQDCKATFRGTAGKFSRSVSLRQLPLRALLPSLGFEVGLTVRGWIFGHVRVE